jgi:hypothetical protein
LTKNPFNHLKKNKHICRSNIVYVNDRINILAPRMNDWRLDLRPLARAIVCSLKATGSSIFDSSSGRRMYWCRFQGDGFEERSRWFFNVSGHARCGDIIGIENHDVKVCRK